MTITAPQGLEGVVVACTTLSDVDGEGGRLIIRGVPIERLAGHRRLEEVAAMLWQGLSPDDETSATVTRDLGQARAVAFEQMAGAFAGTSGLSPMDALRALLSHAHPRDGVRAHHLATASIAVASAAIGRLRAGHAPLAPDAAVPHAADFLRMLHGAPPSSAHANALDAYLVTVSDHGMNASTFTARVVASTSAGVLPATIAALCALQGPLHGGAPGPVLDMLDAIQDESRGAFGVGATMEQWLEREVAQGRRLMGFGHRIYRVRDPRADVLSVAVERLRGSDGGRLAFARAVESAALAVLRRHKPQRSLQTNVEFYTALLLEALSIDRALFTATFAIGRALGWTAHVLEQERGGRLMRPASRYVGPVES